MINRAAHSILAKHLVLLFVGIIMAYAGFSTFDAPTVHAQGSKALADACVKRHFFGLDPWWEYIGPELDDGSGGGKKCDVRCFNVTDVHPANKCGQDKSDIPLILLAIVDDLLRIAALVTIGFVFYGAFQFVTSQGDPDGSARARTTIINALAGLALAMTAVAIVSFLGKKLGG